MSLLECRVACQEALVRGVVAPAPQLWQAIRAGLQQSTCTKRASDTMSLCTAPPLSQSSILLSLSTSCASLPFSAARSSWGSCASLPFSAAR